MLSLDQNIVLLVITCVLSVAFTLALNRVWPREKRPNQNDLIGWQLSILGTTYAVILGFMLYAVGMSLAPQRLTRTWKRARFGMFIAWRAACRRDRKRSCRQRRGRMLRLS